MSQETQPITKADLDALKQAIGKVTPKVSAVKNGGRLRHVTYTR